MIALMCDLQQQPKQTGVLGAVNKPLVVTTVRRPYTKSTVSNTGSNASTNSQPTSPATPKNKYGTAVCRHLYRRLRDFNTCRTPFTHEHVELTGMGGKKTIVFSVFLPD